jgi:hypothetical protein
LIASVRDAENPLRARTSDLILLKIPMVQINLEIFHSHALEEKEGRGAVSWTLTSSTIKVQIFV